MTREAELNLRPIGWLETCFPECFGTPRQGALAPASTAKLQLAADLKSQGFLDGLEDFSHIWLIWHFHKNENFVAKGKVYPPRLSGGKLGVFATRSPHRPNALGLTLAKIEAVAEDSIILSGIDLIDGTPVFDIKPYIPEADHAPEAKRGWLENLADKKLCIDWSEEASAALAANVDLPVSRAQFKNLVEQIIALDPRPETHRKIQKIFYVQLFALDIGFIVDNEIARVVTIRAARVRAPQL